MYIDQLLAFFFLFFFSFSLFSKCFIAARRRQTQHNCNSNKSIRSNSPSRYLCTGRLYYYLSFDNKELTRFIKRFNLLYNADVYFTFKICPSPKKKTNMIQIGVGYTLNNKNIESLFFISFFYQISQISFSFFFNRSLSHANTYTHININLYVYQLLLSF